MVIADNKIKQIFPDYKLNIQEYTIFFVINNLEFVDFLTEEEVKTNIILIDDRVNEMVKKYIEKKELPELPFYRILRSILFLLLIALILIFVLLSHDVIIGIASLLLLLSLFPFVIRELKTKTTEEQKWQEIVKKWCENQEKNNFSKSD